MHPEGIGVDIYVGVYTHRDPHTYMYEHIYIHIAEGGSSYSSPARHFCFSQEVGNQISSYIFLTFKLL